MEKEFRENFAGFMTDFDEKFIEFFSSQCSNYDYALNKEETRSIAVDILDNLFANKLNFKIITDENILQMKKDGVFMGFLLNKSLFYVLENYSVFLQKDINANIQYIEKLTIYFRRFSKLFENYINYSVDSSKTTSFGDNNYVYSSNNILDIFKNIQNENKTVEFMNLYQGYPIKSNGKIIDIDDEEVVFEIENELQEIAMKLEGKAYIVKNEFFHRHIKGEIVYSNFSNNTIVLTNFTYLLNLPAVQRKYPRIYPRILIIVKLLGSDKSQVMGNLYDVSQNGIGMISAENRGFYNGARVSIEFELTSLGKRYNIKTAGEIVDIMQYMNSFRYCLKIFPDYENLNKIIKYIEVRKEEILNELKNEFGGYIV